MGRFRHQSALVALVCLALASSHAQEPPLFRASSRLVNLLVTVKDANGQLIGNLSKDDFAITDSAIAQSIRVFEHHTEVPLSVSLLIDVSGSTGKDIDYEIDAIRKFTRALFKEGNPLDALALYSFNHEVTQRSSFTRRQSRIDTALSRLRPESGTSLHDAVFLASKDLTNRTGRHVMIIVTDGGDTTSTHNFQSALRALQDSEIVAYPILVTPITTDPGRNLGGERVLAQFASLTGGRVFEPTVSTQLDRIFAEILRDLRTQYLLAYQPQNLPPDLPSFHPIKVTVKAPELRVSARSGYYEDVRKR
jgi:Ca-activated chloride channel homolog